MALGVFATAAAALLWAPGAIADPQSDASDAINQAWQAAGGDTSSVGTKDGDVYAVGDGFAQNFSGGKIFFTPATGAHLLTGAILDKYTALGGPADSDLGFPTIDSVPGLVGPDSRVSTFSASDKPAIFWTPDTGAWVVRGAINAAWDKLGGSAGTMGVPTEDETYNGSVVSQKFTGGEISYDTAAKTFSTVPPELANNLAGVEVPSDATTAINQAWRAAGGLSGPLGARQGAQQPIGTDGAAQDYAGARSQRVGDELVGQLGDRLQAAGDQAVLGGRGVEEADDDRDGRAHRKGGVGEMELRIPERADREEFLDVKLMDRIVSHRARLLRLSPDRGSCPDLETYFALLRRDT